MRRIVAVSLFCAVMLSCGKKDKKDKPAADNTATVTPGALMIKLDAAMGSVGFQGQAGGSLLLSNAAWIAEHCDADAGSGVKKAYYGQVDVEWGCKLAVVTMGPDTPRGAMQRVKSLACSLDKLLTNGSFVFDGAAHVIRTQIDEGCWGKTFSDMAKQMLPDKINPATGLVEGNVTYTGYDTVPNTIGDPGKWDKAVIIDNSEITGKVFVYTMLLKIQGDTQAVSIKDHQGADNPKDIIAVALSKDTVDSSKSSLRYEGRFPFGTFGDGTQGARHVKMRVTGTFAEATGFSAVTDGEGYEANLYSKDGGGITGFKAVAAGIGTRRVSVNVSGDVVGAPVDTWNGAAGTTPPTLFSYAGTVAQKAVFLNSNVATFTSSDDWHKANGPISFDSISVGD